jgi:rhamnosyltransferase
MLTPASVSIFIPTLNAQAHLKLMLPILTSSEVETSNIIIVDSSSSDKTADICHQFGIQFHSIQRNEFNHGKTRNLGLQLCTTDFIVFMTQDALPCDTNFLKELLIPFEDKLVAATYSRQYPRSGSGSLERLDRIIKYPDYDLIQSQDTASQLGSRTYFLSNSCAAYRMSTFHELGGFPEDEIMGEDAIFAYKAISKGYKIVYASKSEVYHSHDYTFRELFKRYFDTGVYRTKTLQLSTTSEAKGDVNQGSSYARSILSKLIEQQEYALIPEFILNLGFSFLGYSLGKRYQLIPNWLRKKLSMHSFYWQQHISSPSA